MVLTVVYNIQNHWILWSLVHRPVLETRKHDISKTLNFAKCCQYNSQVRPESYCVLTSVNYLLRSCTKMYDLKLFKEIYIIYIVGRVTTNAEGY